MNRGSAGRWLLVILAALPLLAAASDSGEKLRALLKDGELSGDWVYDDLDGALKRAGKEGKPVLAVLRCVP